MASSSDRPVRDSGIPVVPREAPYRAGGKQQGDLSSRKEDLLHTGTIGHVPGHAGSRRLPDMYVQDRQPYEPAPFRPGVLQDGPRPLPRERPVYTQTTHFGNITRYADGHSEIHRDRPALVAELNHPGTDPDDREDIRAEIAHRDGLYGHRLW